MRRIFTPFQFCASLEKDKPENQILRILSGGSTSRQDWLEVERKQAAQNDASLAEFESGNHDSRYVSMSDLDISGAWTAAHAGPDQLQRWRDDNIKADDWTEKEMEEATDGNGTMDVSYV